MPETRNKGIVIGAMVDPWRGGALEQIAEPAVANDWWYGYNRDSRDSRAGWLTHNRADAPKRFLAGSERGPVLLVAGTSTTQSVPSTTQSVPHFMAREVLDALQNAMEEEQQVGSSALAPPQESEQSPSLVDMIDHFLYSGSGSSSTVPHSAMVPFLAPVEHSTPVLHSTPVPSSAPVPFLAPVSHPAQVAESALVRKNASRNSEMFDSLLKSLRVPPEPVVAMKTAPAVTDGMLAILRPVDDPPVKSVVRKSPGRKLTNPIDWDWADAPRKSFPDPLPPAFVKAAESLSLLENLPATLRKMLAETLDKALPEAFLRLPVATRQQLVRNMADAGLELSPVKMTPDRRLTPSEQQQMTRFWAELWAEWMQTLQQKAEQKSARSSVSKQQAVTQNHAWLHVSLPVYVGQTVAIRQPLPLEESVAAPVLVVPDPVVSSRSVTAFVSLSEGVAVSAPHAVSATPSVSEMVSKHVVASVVSPVAVPEVASLASSVAPSVVQPVLPPVSASVVSPVSAPVVPPVSASVVPPVSASVVPPVSASVVPPVSAPVVPPVSAPVVPPVSSPVVPPVSAPVVPSVSASVAASAAPPVVAPVARPVVAPMNAVMSDPVAASGVAPKPYLAPESVATSPSSSASDKSTSLSRHYLISPRFKPGEPVPPGYVAIPFLTPELIDSMKNVETSGSTSNVNTSGSPLPLNRESLSLLQTSAAPVADVARTHEPAALVPVESLGLGVLNLLSDVAGVGQASKRQVLSQQVKPPLPATFYERMGGTVYYGGQSVVAGVAGVIAGSVGLVVGTAGCLLDVVGSVGQGMLGNTHSGHVSRK